ncbi:hypothetical protein D3C86_2116830 [compost metagenome]
MFGYVLKPGRQMTVCEMIRGACLAMSNGGYGSRRRYWSVTPALSNSVTSSAICGLPSSPFGRRAAGGYWYCHTS